MSRSEGGYDLVHLANFNSTNIGNGALICGLETTVEEDSPVGIRWCREPWDDYTFGLIDFDESFVEKVNAADGLIVGGAVTFNGRDYNRRTGTRFELPLEMWSRLKKPVVFYGLSYRHWQGQTYHHLDKLTWTLERILSMPNMILSVRNDGTKKWLKNMTGIDSAEIMEIPDSAIFVNGDDHANYPELMNDSKNIMVSFNDEDADYRYDERYSVEGVSNRSRDHVIGQLVSAVERLADEYSVNLILCPHYFDDYRMMSAFLERIRPRLAHQRMVSTGLCRVKDTGLFYGRYKRADLSISMRVHSMSPCIGLGTPMVAYSTQGRMTEFMDRIGLGSQTVDAFALGAGNDLFTCARSSLENGEAVRSRFQDARLALRNEARAFHRKLFDLIAA